MGTTLFSSKKCENSLSSTRQYPLRERQAVLLLSDVMYEGAKEWWIVYVWAKFRTFSLLIRRQDVNTDCFSEFEATG